MYKKFDFSLNSGSELTINFKIISDLSQVKDACDCIKTECCEIPVIGVYIEYLGACEKWTPAYKPSINESKVTNLIQIATVLGSVYLFYMSNLKVIPFLVKELLEDKTILKLGVSPQYESLKLKKDFGINFTSTLDLRILFNTPVNIAKLAKDQLGMSLFKGDPFKELVSTNSRSFKQKICYTSKEAFAAVELFKKWAGLTFSKPGSPNFMWNDIEPFIKSFYDISYENASTTAIKQLTEMMEAKKEQCLVVVTDPEGRFLWNISKSFAQMIVAIGKAVRYGSIFRLVRDAQPIKNYGDKMNFKAECGVDDPPKFELKEIKHLANEIMSIDSGECPAVVNVSPIMPRLEAKPVVNHPSVAIERCVVCGSTGSLSKKTIVPRQYIALFPEILRRENTLPLCHPCVQNSNAYFEQLFAVIRYLAGLPTFQTIADSIEAQRLNAYQRGYHPQESVVSEFLRTSFTWIVKCRSHVEPGLAVVELYRENNIPLSELRKLWRKAFVGAMQPKFLPQNWSV